MTRQLLLHVTHTVQPVKEHCFCQLVTMRQQLALLIHLQTRFRTRTSLELEGLVLAVSFGGPFSILLYFLVTNNPIYEVQTDLTWDSMCNLLLILLWHKWKLVSSPLGTSCWRIHKISSCCYRNRCRRWFLGVLRSPHCEPKKYTPKCFDMQSTKPDRLWQNLVRIVLSKFVVQKCKRFLPHLNNVSTLPCKT